MITSLLMLLEIISILYSKPCFLCANENLRKTLIFNTLLYFFYFFILTFFYLLSLFEF